MSRERFKLLAVLMLLTIGILRFSALGRQGAWDDESFTLRALGVIPAPMAMAEGTPPLYFLLLRSWVAIAGTSLTAVRAFSALWGFIGAALIGLFAGRVLSPAAGLFSAALLGLHPFHLAYSQEARPYALVFALATATIWMAWERRLWLFMLSSTALLWVHPWGVFVWLSSAALPLMSLRPACFRTSYSKSETAGELVSPMPGSGRGSRLDLLLCLAPAILAAPALWHFTQLPLFESFWAKPPDLRFLASVAEALGGGAFYVGGWRFESGWPGRLLLLTFTVLWVAGLLSEDTQRTRQKILLPLIGMLLLSLSAGWLEPQASAHQRYWLALLPLTLLLAARGWKYLPGSFRGVVCVLCLAGVLGTTIHYFSRWQKGNVLQAVRIVEAQASSSAVLIVPPYMQPLWRYYSRLSLPLVDEQGIDGLAPILERHSRAVMVTLDVPNPVRDALDRRFTVLGRTHLPADFNLGILVTFYSTR